MPDGLRLEGVSAGYGGRPVIRDLDLSVAPGEVVGLVGPNGSGKTTLVRTASRAVRPTAGRVLADGRDLHGLAARDAARAVAVVPQEVPALFPFTVLEMVLMGRSPYLRPWGGGSSRDWSLARTAMETAGVQHLADRPFQELSGGERQRVVLAQALAQDAPVLLLDEPTTHLDVRHVVDTLGLVRDLAELEGTAVLAIFHDLDLAAAVSDRICVLLAGRIAAQGPPGSVVTTELLRTVYGVDAEVHPNPVTGRPSVSLGPPRRRPVGRGLPRAHVIGGAGRGAPLIRALAERGFEVSVGVLHATDTDAVLAERLNLARVTVPPFSEIDPASRDEALALATRAGLVLVADAPYGPGNLANLDLALAAAQAGARVVLLEETPMAERDFTGGQATAMWDRLRRAAEEAGTYARTYDEAVSTLGGTKG